MENNEKILSETEQKEVFQKKLRESFDDFLSCSFTKDYPLSSREKAIKKAEEILTVNGMDIERILLDQDNWWVIFRFFEYFMDYAQNGNVKDDVMTLVEDKELRKHSVPKILSFLNDKRDALSCCFVKSFEVGNLESGRVLPGDVCIFCQKYFELTISLKNEKLIEESVLSLMHILLPLSEIAKKEQNVERNEMTDDEISRERSLNQLALLSGDEETIQLFVEEFLSGRKNAEQKNHFFTNLKDFFSSGRQWCYSREIEASIISEYKEDFLRCGFAEEEIERAIQILTESVGERIAGKILEPYGLSFEDFSGVWEKSKLKETIGSKLSAIRDIETIKPGSVKQLSDGPGKIRCFERYDWDFLLQQLEPLKPGEPYGVMCNAYEDHNGAFRNRQGIHKKIRDESSRLGMKTRLMEYFSESEWCGRLFNQLAEIAPPEKGEDFPRADYIWINQHGNSHENNPGTMGHKRRIWEHVFGVGPNRSSLILKSGGAIGSFMCFGGEEGNAMDILAKEYDITATGATKPPSNIYGVKFEKDEKGQLRIDIDYGYSSTHPGKTAIYKYE